MGVFTKAITDSVDKLMHRHSSINGLWMPAIALLDFTFLLLFGMGGFFFAVSSENHLANIVESGGRLTSEITAALAEGASPLGTFISDSLVMSNLLSIIGNAIIFAVFVYLLWIGLEGLAWFIARNKIEKTERRKYFAEFSLLSAKIFLFIAVYVVVITSGILAILLRPERIISSEAISVIVTALNTITAYFILISLAYLPKNSLWIGFKKGIKKIHYFGSAFLIVILLLYVFSMIVSLIIENPTAEMFAGFIVVAPFLIWARLLFIELAKKV